MKTVPESMFRHMETVHIGNKILFQNLDTSFYSFEVYSNIAIHRMAIFEHNCQTSGMGNALT